MKNENYKINQQKNTENNLPYITTINGKYYYNNGNEMKEMGKDKSVMMINIKADGMKNGDTITIGEKYRLTICNLKKTKKYVKNFDFLLEEI